MIQPIKDYIALRKLGIKDAWQISGMSSIGDKLVGYACCVVTVAFAVYFVIDYKSESEKFKDGYIKELEKVLALCLDDKYHPVKIGDEWFMCGIDKLGK